jgi:tetratricopeptide (TPR) repeat protein
MCYNNRGTGLRDQGKVDEAIADYGRAIEIYEDSLGADHPETVMVRKNLESLQKEGK